MPSATSGPPVTMRPCPASSIDSTLRPFGGRTAPLTAP